MEKSFSVNICVYHKDDPDYFEKAIISITQEQTIKPNEVVIIVDGPIYGELKEKVLQYERQKDLFKVVWLPKNLGHAGARQAGLENSSYDLIAIMDADDISRPDRFKEQLDFIQSNQEVDIIGGQIEEFIGHTNNIVGRRIVPNTNSEIYKYLKKRCPFNQMTVMFKKNEILKVGGYIDWYCNEDYYLWIRMALANCKFANLPNTLVSVRVGKDMYSRRGGWEYFKSESKLQKYLYDHKLLSLPRYFFNITIRFIVQVLLPNKIRGFIFQKLFRK